jgi:hypothetical protein
MQDVDELSPRRDAYREHMRALTTARQAAEHAYAQQFRDPVARHESDRVFEEELARIEAEHQAWLREHGLLPATKPPKSRRRAQ